MTDMTPAKAVMRVTTPPFSGEHGGDGIRMKLVDDGPTAADASVAAAASRSTSEMTADDWKTEVEGATSPEALDDIRVRYAATGKNYKTVATAFENKSSEFDNQRVQAWIDRVNQASDQDSLDAVADAYGDTGDEHDEVMAAIQAKQDEIDNANQ